MWNAIRHGSWNVRTFALLGVVVSIATIFSVVSYVYFQSVSHNIEETIRSDLRQHSRNEAFHLGELLEKDVQFIATNVDIAVNTASIQSGKVEEGSEIINLAQQRTQHLTDRYFWLDAAGKTIWSSAFMNNPAEYEQYGGFDVSDRPYFFEVVRTDKPYFSPVSKSPIDNTQRMFISYPVITDGSFRGAVVASIRADALAKSVSQQLAPGFESSLAIIDSHGDIVYSRTSEHIGENLFGEKIQGLIAPAFVSQEKVNEFNEFLKQSIDPTITTDLESRDFTTATGQTTTISAGQIRILESEKGADEPSQRQILTLYITTPHNVAAKVAPLVDAQRNYSVGVIAAISAAAIIVSYFILSSKKRLEKTVYERTKELKDANEQLKQHDKLQSEFINIAAHELRTPVQPLLGAAEMLEDKLLEGQEEVMVSRPEVEMILRNSKRLAQLTYDILEVSRIESNSLKLQKVQINLKEKIEQAIEDVQGFIDGKDIKIVFEPKANDPVIVEADKTKVFEVLSNLLRNAIKFTEKGTIRVILDKNDSEVIITVIDTGKGIDPEIMPKMFSRFTSKSDSGTGLGLFIAKSIVEAHGGTISGENNPDGIGARFEFTLPLQTVKTETDKEPPKA